MIIQLCGLSGVGKTTLARKAGDKLSAHGIKTEVIDGDEYRKTVCKDLGFSRADRQENIRRLGIIANEFAIKGFVSIISAINPYEAARDALKTNHKNVWTVYLDCSLETLIERDTKGLYKKALLPGGHPQKIENLTGINDLFEIPCDPDLHIHTDLMSPEESLHELFYFIQKEYNKLNKKLPTQQLLKRSA